MNEISPLVPLILGAIAFALFLCLFVGAWIVTMRNRRIISRNTRPKDTDNCQSN